MIWNTIVLFLTLTSYLYAASGPASEFEMNSSETKGKCADFSGRWKGTCSSDQAKGEPSLTTIQQLGCRSIIRDGTSYQIGLQKMSSQTGLHRNESSVGNVDWNKDKTSLSWNNVQNGRVFDYNRSGDSGLKNPGDTIYTVIGDGNWRLTDKKLVVEDHAKILSFYPPEGVRGEKTLTKTCTYEKVADAGFPLIRPGAKYYGGE
jgi:hypothetical protein